jgi:hypothetical protein
VGSIIRDSVGDQALDAQHRGAVHQLVSAILRQLPLTTGMTWGQIRSSTAPLCDLFKLPIY